jgi:hypothetical protein
MDSHSPCFCIFKCVDEIWTVSFMHWNRLNIELLSLLLTNEMDHILSCLLRKWALSILGWTMCGFSFLEGVLPNMPWTPPMGGATTRLIHATTRTSMPPEFLLSLKARIAGCNSSLSSSEPRGNPSLPTSLILSLNELTKKGVMFHWG